MHILDEISIIISINDVCAGEENAFLSRGWKDGALAFHHMARTSGTKRNKARGRLEKSKIQREQGKDESEIQR